MTTLRTRRTASPGTAYKIAAVPCGRLSKYAVLAFWALVLAFSWPQTKMGPVVRLLTGVEAALLFPTLAAVLLILLFTYRNPLLWLVPVLSAAVALTAAQAVLNPLASHGLTVTGQDWEILVVLVIGASTGYPLLLVPRYREGLLGNADRHHAMAAALRRAVPAIIASTATVVAGMLGLLVADPADMPQLGPVVAAGIAAGLLTSITLLPALLVVCGRFARRPMRPADGSTGTPGRPGNWLHSRPACGQKVGTPAPARTTAGAYQPFPPGKEGDPTWPTGSVAMWNFSGMSSTRSST